MQFRKINISNPRSAQMYAGELTQLGHIDIEDYYHSELQQDR